MSCSTWEHSHPSATNARRSQAQSGDAEPARAVRTGRREHGARPRLAVHGRRPAHRAGHPARPVPAGHPGPNGGAWPPTASCSNPRSPPPRASSPTAVATGRRPSSRPSSTSSSSMRRTRDRSPTRLDALAADVANSSRPRPLRADLRSREEHPRHLHRAAAGRHGRTGHARCRWQLPGPDILPRPNGATVWLAPLTPSRTPTS